MSALGSRVIRTTGSSRPWCSLVLASSASRARRNGITTTITERHHAAALTVLLWRRGGGARCCSCSTSAAAEDGVSAGSSVLDDWRFRVERGILQEDAGQEQAAKRLRRLQCTLERLQWDNECVRQYNNEATTMRDGLEQQQEPNGEEEDTEKHRIDQHSKSTAPHHVVHHPRPRRRRSNTEPTTSGDDASEIEQHQQKQSATSVENRVEDMQQEPELPEKPSIPRGLYLYGNVGTGKSMLMDQFFALTSTTKKRRYHFHEFITDMHRRMHEHRTHNNGGTTNKSLSAAASALTAVERTAHELSKQYSLLCLDEFQILDVADAVLLRQVLGFLLANGTVLVTTSNRPLTHWQQPHLDEHSQWVAALLQRYCVSHDMGTDQDYRQVTAAAMAASMEQDEDGASNHLGNNGMYIVMDDDARQGALQLEIDQVLQRVLGDEFETSVETFRLGGRRNFEVVTFTSSSSSSSSSTSSRTRILAQISFDDLCVHNHLVAAEYKILAEHFDGILLTHIPVVSDSLRGHDQARRFVHCIDCLYEARVPVLCTAHTPLDQLFVTTQRQQPQDNNSSDLLWADQATNPDGYTLGALVSVQDLPVAMRRAASRLAEMTSHKWWNDKLFHYRRSRTSDNEAQQEVQE